MKNIMGGRRTIKNFLLLLGGVMLYALALNLFLAKNNLVAGGLSGIATALSTIVPLKISELIFIMNVPLLIISLFIKGKEFTFNTIIGSTLYTLAVEVTSYLPVMTNDPIVATAYGGAMFGMGTTLLVMGNASSGGTDIIIRIVNTYFPQVSIGRAGMFVDGAAVVFAMVLYGNIEVGLYAILTISISSLVADKLLLGFDKATFCLIVTDKDSKEIADQIMQRLQRSVTEFKGKGMYTDTEKNILFSVMKPAEVPKMKRFLGEIDPKAFVIVMPASEVLGEGFKESWMSASKLP